jgi:hypothetical protein
MKYLKKFEELSPEFIRAAGNELISKGHSERGLDLLDKSYSGNTPFNVWITGLDGTWLKRLPKGDSDRSEPVSLSYNFSSSKFYFYPTNAEYELNNENMNAEKLIQFWEQGKCDLGFNIHFYFKPTKETIKELKLDKKHFDSEVTLFSINFLIHKKLKNNDLLKVKLSNDSFYLQEYFNKINENETRITLDLPCKDNKETFQNPTSGLFSDRKSALNFRNNILPKVLDEQGDKIMEVLSIINIKSDKADEILNFYKNVKVNYLYRSEIPHYVNWASDIKNYLFSENEYKDIRS